MTDKHIETELKAEMFDFVSDTLEFYHKCEECCSYSIEKPINDNFEFKTFGCLSMETCDNCKRSWCDKHSHKDGKCVLNNIFREYNTSMSLRTVCNECFEKLFPRR